MAAPRDPAAGLLWQMIEQLDEKHTDAHQRIRRDLTEGLNEDGRLLERHSHDLVTMKLDIQALRTGRDDDRRYSNHRLIIWASLIGSLTSSLVAGLVLLIRALLGK